MSSCDCNSGSLGFLPSFWEESFEEACDKIRELQNLIAQFEWEGEFYSHGSMEAACFFCEMPAEHKVHLDSCPIPKALESYP